MTSKLYTDSELNFERVFEIRIRDLRKRQGVSQRSFSLSVAKGTKDDDYPTADELKSVLENIIRTSKWGVDE